MTIPHLKSNGYSSKGFWLVFRILWGFCTVAKCTFRASCPRRTGRFYWLNILKHKVGGLKSKLQVQVSLSTENGTLNLHQSVGITCPIHLELWHLPFSQPLLAAPDLVMREEPTPLQLLLGLDQGSECCLGGAKELWGTDLNPGSHLTFTDIRNYKPTERYTHTPKKPHR